MIGIFFDDKFVRHWIRPDYNFLRVKYALDKYKVENKIVNLEQLDGIDKLVVDDIFEPKVIDKIREANPNCDILVFKNESLIKGSIDVLSNKFKLNILGVDDYLWKFPKAEVPELNLTYENQRGLVFRSHFCKYRCSFCYMPKYLFIRDPEWTLDEVNYASKRTKLPIRIYDYDFLSNLKEAKRFLKTKISRKSKAPLYLETAITPDILQVVEDLQKANVVLIKTGIDHLVADFRRQVLRKPSTLDQVFEILDELKSRNVTFKFRFNFMIGHPEETPEIRKEYFENFKKFMDRYNSLTDRLCLYTFRIHGKPPYNTIWSSKNSTFKERYETCQKFAEYASKYLSKDNILCNQFF